MGIEILVGDDSMNDKKSCSKCNSEMIKGTESGYFAVIETVNPTKGKVTSTNDFMCKNCGFIEIYAKNPNFAD